MKDLIQTNPTDPFAALRTAVRNLLRNLPQRYYTHKQKLQLLTDIETLIMQRVGQFPPGYAIRDLLRWATKHEYVRHTKRGWRIEPDPPNETPQP